MKPRLANLNLTKQKGFEEHGFEGLPDPWYGVRYETFNNSLCAVYHPAIVQRDITNTTHWG